MDSDLERARVEQLLRRLRGGIASDAEREELALYGVEIPAPDGLDACGPQPSPDQQWMERVEADERIDAAESSAWARAERGIGATLLIGGGLAGLVAPAAVLVSLVGAGVLIASVVRIKIKTLGQDPYEDIKR